MPHRHRSDATRLSAFHDEVLVTCPKCAQPGVVMLAPLEPAARAGPLRARTQARFTCMHCGDNARQAAFVRRTNGAFDPVFGLPVWLHATCRHGTLWAYNLRHLSEIEAFVGARLRERRPRATHGWANRAWASRLPRWILLAKNRQDVLQCISRIRQKHGGASAMPPLAPPVT